MAKAAPLPARILACLTALPVQLQPVALLLRDAPLAELVAAMLALLTAVVEGATSALDAGVATVRQRCPHRGERVRVDRWRPRQVWTVCRPFTLSRPWYACRPSGHGFSPVDATLACRPARG